MNVQRILRLAKLKNSSEKALKTARAGRILQTARVNEAKEQKKLKTAKARRELTSAIGGSAKNAIKNADTSGNAAPIIQSAETGRKIFKIYRQYNLTCPHMPKTAFLSRFIVFCLPTNV